MTHELKKIFTAHQEAKAQGIRCVLATVVALEGSSYRRPGVRMLILENGYMIGAVSGGCVEKEVYRQAETVFKDDIPKVMTYDGRYRLGCEGILYILLEPFCPEKAVVDRFWKTITDRKAFDLQSHYKKEHGVDRNYGSFLDIDGHLHSFRDGFSAELPGMDVYRQKMPPCFRIILIGTEHDAVQLASFAAMTGWEVTVIAHPKEEKLKKDFPGASDFILNDGEALDLAIDKETAIMLMTHSYAKDLKYLLALQDQYPAYFGLLGPTRRREKLFNSLLEHHPDVPEEFITQIHGPAGLDIGAETPQEIALAILAEILAVTRQKAVISLREKEGTIHA